MPTEITIKNNGSVAFETVSVPLSETVFWQNLDAAEPHWPNYQGQPMTRTQIGTYPSTNSDSWPMPQNTAPFTVTYQCSLHPGESGSINVYADLAPVAKLAKGAAGQAYGPQPLTAGGLAPLSWALASALPAGLTISPPSGSGAVLELGGTAPAAGTYQFTLGVTDAAGNNFQQQNYTLTVS
jgi:hypothetical protein